MKAVKQTLMHVLVIVGLAILPLFGTGAIAEVDVGSGPTIYSEDEVPVNEEAQVTNLEVRVGGYRGRGYYYRSYYYNYPQRTYYRRYHAPRARYPRYNYRYYYYENYRPYGPAYYGS